jgi:hypothetical protein
MEDFFLIPNQAWGPFLLWILVTVIQIPWIIWCLGKIEKSGVKRWGACGRLFSTGD